jgi:hypothetical protein
MEKIVKYDEYCDKCKHKDIPEDEDPCNECLTEPVNEDSRKPINYKEK